MSAPEAGRLTARYRLWVASPAEAEALAEAIAREQTIEVPAGVGGAELQARLLGRIEAVVEASADAYDATISYPLEVTGTELPNVLNVAYGNVSLMDGVRLVDLEPPDEVIGSLPGPGLGIDGVRALVGAADRPLVSVAIKPVGRSTADLARLAADFARAGVDVIKDDHGLVDQRWAPFEERVARVAEAVAEASARSGGRGAYFPNVTGPVDSLERRLERVREAGCPGVVLCPSLTGLDGMRALAARRTGLALMAHPTHAQTSPGRREGIAPELLFGTLYRAVGADIVIYVNARGRFGWPVEVCEAINARLRGPLGGLRPALPAPAGGVQAGEAAAWLERYGPDTMLLIGGSLLAQHDVHAATSELVEVARAAPSRADAATGAGGRAP